MKTIIYFIEHHSINWPLIWSDCSPYICIWLLFLVLLAFLLVKNYNKAVKNEYLVKTTAKLCALNGTILYLQEENKSLLVRVQKSERKRDEKGHYLTTSGKGHGKRKKQIS